MAKASKAQLRGEVKILPLDSVKPNPWNPNRMTDEMKKSMKHGFIKDGWLVSQALLIWGKDDKGVQRDIIIDGEHRWSTAKDLGMPEGPMVFLDGVSEAEAKALTIKMNQKRGEFVDTLLADVLHDIAAELGTDDLGLDLGFGDEELMTLMADAPEAMEAGTADAHRAEQSKGYEAEVGDGKMRSSGTHVRLIQLFFDKEQHDEFQVLIQKLSKIYKTTNVTETVLEAVRDITKRDAPEEK